MISIYDKELVVEHFDKFPTTPITLYCPGSGSWCETFDNKEHYSKRMAAWDAACKGDYSLDWVSLRGKVSSPLDYEKSNYSKSS